MFATVLSDRDNSSTLSIPEDADISPSAPHPIGGRAPAASVNTTGMNIIVLDDMYEPTRPRHILRKNDDARI